MQVSGNINDVLHDYTLVDVFIRAMNKHLLQVCKRWLDVIDRCITGDKIVAEYINPSFNGPDIYKCIANMPARYYSLMNKEQQIEIPNILLHNCMSEQLYLEKYTLTIAWPEVFEWLCNDVDAIFTVIPPRSLPSIRTYFINMFMVFEQFRRHVMTTYPMPDNLRKSSRLYEMGLSSDPLWLDPSTIYSYYRKNTPKLMLELEAEYAIICTKTTMKAHS